jgi:transglutaminase-like putative cysteine protease
VVTASHGPVDRPPTAAQYQAEVSVKAWPCASVMRSHTRSGALPVRVAVKQRQRRCRASSSSRVPTMRQPSAQGDRPRPWTRSRVLPHTPRMATLYDIHHTTIYRYRTPVRFGLHRVMFRPRDSHDLRVLATDLQVSPLATVRLIQDPHSNSVALVQPVEPATLLTIVCAFTVEHVPAALADLQLDAAAEHLPFAYGLQDRLDLEHYLRPHHEDPEGVLIRWAQQFLRAGEANGTRETLTRMNAWIHKELKYQARDEQGTQPPVQTLALGGGSCRDYALLMMEGLRRLGVATRFVSGYLYDPALDADAQQPGESVVGAGATHAWLQAYLPGVGWLAFDPTNNHVGSGHLLRVGVARDPAFAAPIAGSWFGEADAYEGLEVVVKVTRRRQ